MAYLLFPGRHLVTTAFQSNYLRSILQMPPAQLPYLTKSTAAGVGEPLDQIVFAVTSSNQAHSRYNPIPFHVRAIGVDRFARPLEMTFGIGYRIIGIPHYRPTPRFAEIVLKEIAAQTEGHLQLTPANCAVICSTPAVIEQYQALGFAILPAELNHSSPLAATPHELMQTFVAAGEEWFASAELRQKLSTATFDLWQDFPDIPRRILRLWRDPLLTDSGDLTESRDYNTYAMGMSNMAIMRLKYQDIKWGLKPGKIVDEGCADGALLSLIARDFPDSDLIGIEITGEFLARCLERQRSGDFGGSYVHFHQRNITHQLFENDSIDTTICNSTTHELWSYGEQAVTLRAYLANKYAQTAPGGRLIIRDVVGPENGDREVYLWLNGQDGHNEAVFAEFAASDDLKSHLGAMSTKSRFLRFARDFLASERALGQRGPETALQYRLETIANQEYVVLPLRDACEFLSKKDYTDNWESEMHEEFAYWSFSDWQRELEAIGFRLLQDRSRPEANSRSYVNPWIVENRYQGTARLFHHDGQALQPLPFPPTNVVLFAEKPHLYDL